MWKSSSPHPRHGSRGDGSSRNDPTNLYFVVLYCNFTSLAFLGLLGFLRRQLKIKFIATLLRAAKSML